MAIPTPNIALRDLGIDPGLAEPVCSQSRDHRGLSAPLAMIEIEHPDIAFAAIHARMG
ncbi:hypothetical protein [Gryllotalpicola protaetiae]|uniref:hypothetical protein n=1 Tax=Gryllotalpicola protaetiae TaxID=2419771 RepID=UPI0013C516A5|nr:hypothetical protein [Gryllotalpicola protaetiae]